MESRTIGSERPPTPKWLLALVLFAVGLSGCSASPAASTIPIPTWPVPPEQLPEPTSGSEDLTLTCDGRTFPASGLDAPTGAEEAPGPEFDALRATISRFADAFPGSSDWTWRLAGRDDSGAIFLAKAEAIGPPDWVAIEVASGESGWEPGTMGQCDPHVVLSAEFGPATWAVDPEFPTPAAGTTELHIHVWERACSGGSPATGRMSAPVVQYTSAAVTITIGVRPLQVAPGTALTCPGPPGTPAFMRLSEPLGTRTLLDGGVVPPAAPSPPT